MTPLAPVIRRQALDVGQGTLDDCWRILSTPPMSGAENMAYDLDSLSAVEQGAPPILRLFRWDRPTVSYGRLQKLEHIHVPAGWDAVQRPTGGGWVSHNGDLCLSLCWRHGQAPLPRGLSKIYAWIHRVILNVLNGQTSARLADCDDCKTPIPVPTARTCFKEPVPYDVLLNGRKIVGGALFHQRQAMLYQGSIQNANFPELEDHLRNAFANHLTG